MFEFSIFTDNNIIPTKDIVLLGIKMDLLKPIALKDFLYWKVEQGYELSEEEFVLLDDSNSKTSIFSHIDEDMIPSDDLSSDILRYTLLSSLNISDPELLQKIEDIYSTFDYPEEMNSCIYYMPNAETEKILNDDPKVNIIKHFKQFLQNEKARLNL